MEVLKVLSQDGVLQRMWSRSLIFLFVEVFKVFSQVRVPHCADFFKMRMGGFQGGFSHFSPAQKSAEVTRQSECESARQSQLIRAERSSNGSCPGV